MMQLNTGIELESQSYQAMNHTVHKPQGIHPGSAFRCKPSVNGHWHRAIFCCFYVFENQRYHTHVLVAVWRSIGNSFIFRKKPQKLSNSLNQLRWVEKCNWRYICKKCEFML